MEIIRKTIENDLEYLRQVSMPVDINDKSYLEDIIPLSKFCKENNQFLALAAIQIGIPKRIIYLRKTTTESIYDDDHDEEIIMINPEILEEKGKTKYLEACGSCLDNSGVVIRPYKIKLEYLDVDGNKHIEDIEGFKTTVICHEVDHLNGILHMDKSIELFHMTLEERKKYREEHPYEIISKE